MMKMTVMGLMTARKASSMIKTRVVQTVMTTMPWMIQWVSMVMMVIIILFWLMAVAGIISYIMFMYIIIYTRGANLYMYMSSCGMMHMGISRVCVCVCVCLCVCICFLCAVHPPINCYNSVLFVKGDSVS